MFFLREEKQMYYAVNTDLALDTARKARECGVWQFIFMSSMIVYGILWKIHPAFSAENQSAEELAQIVDMEHGTAILPTCSGTVLMTASVASMIDQFNLPNIRLLKEMGYEVDVATKYSKPS